MSVQFGRWNFEGQPPAPDYIEKVSAALAPYGPDSNESYAKEGVKILYRAFHTTKEAHFERQPHVCASGAVITWDGRLDNRAEFISELRGSLTANFATGYSAGTNTAGSNSTDDFTDVEIVAAAYEKWGPHCFANLIGDWALSVWSPINRSLILAKDPVGTHHIFYSFDNHQVTWSTILDPLVLFAGKTFVICEEYIAGWFATMFPAVHRTPYVGIHAVPPSSSVFLRPGKHIVSKYWDFDPGKKIRYRTDAEYEEHFRTVLATAAQRRLRSDRPVLAELSGGMDSSSIVCVSDMVIARGQAACPRLDTITWYDESKPYWGELPHFTKVEGKRGRVGHHVDVGSLKDDKSQTPFGAEFASDRFAATPIPNSRPSELSKQNAAYIRSRGYRVTLSGIGGEFTGDGVPTPTPEFQNLLARARFFTLSRQLKAWAAKMRKPRPPLLWEAVRGFSPLALRDIPEYVNPAPPWFHRGFARRNRAPLRDYPSPVRLFGPLPSFQHNLRALEASRKLLAHWLLEPESLREIRFPYFDRDLLEFLYAIPREQIVRVGQRRSLMKRALVGIVPDEILNRRKIVPQETPKNVSAERTSAEWPSLAEMGGRMVGSSLGIIDPDRFWEALQKARRNEEVPGDSLRRTLTLESWLRHLTSQGVLTDLVSTKRQKRSSSLEAKGLRTPTQPRSLAS
jgi:asparagine synthase (glutamine-hydrolysing)